jgi:hypothetical protein
MLGPLMKKLESFKEEEFSTEGRESVLEVFEPYAKPDDITNVLNYIKTAPSVHPQKFMQKYSEMLYQKEEDLNISDDEKENDIKF